MGTEQGRWLGWFVLCGWLFGWLAGWFIHMMADRMNKLKLFRFPAFTNVFACSRPSKRQLVFQTHMWWSESSSQQYVDAVFWFRVIVWGTLLAAKWYLHGKMNTWSTDAKHRMCGQSDGLGSQMTSRCSYHHEGFSFDSTHTQWLVCSLAKQSFLLSKVRQKSHWLRRKWVSTTLKEKNNAPGIPDSFVWHRRPESNGRAVFKLSIFVGCSGAEGPGVSVPCTRRN